MVISIGVYRNQNTAKNWKETYGITHPVLADPNGVVWSRYGSGYIPHNTVHDDAMFVRYTNSGWNENVIRNRIATWGGPLVKIKHDEIDENFAVGGNLGVDATIYSDANIVESSTMVFWNIDGGTSFTEAPMTYVSDDTYTGAIPEQAVGSMVYYYFHAEADNGKMADNPFFAPDELYSFTVADPPGPTPTTPPTSTPTPQPTETPEACGALGVTLEMPAHSFGPGDGFSTTATICNPGPNAYTQVPFLTVLDIQGLYFFWPSFSDYDFQMIDVPVGEFDIQILPEFTWPSGAGEFTGAFWYSAMLTPDFGGLLGDMAMMEFGWHN